MGEVEKVSKKYTDIKQYDEKIISTLTNMGFDVNESGLTSYEKYPSITAKIDSNKITLEEGRDAPTSVRDKIFKEMGMGEYLKQDELKCLSKTTDDGF
ncbi:MAG: hypothetical protein KAS04_07275, partial [Candidatus Aenigmarchaeota archaeon]|nr:hypothetical protein [Candidatus Aenigmarchaeota archaeon]